MDFLPPRGELAEISRRSKSISLAFAASVLEHARRSREFSQSKGRPESPPPAPTQEGASVFAGAPSLSYGPELLGEGYGNRCAPFFRTILASDRSMAPFRLRSRTKLPLA